LEIVNEIEAGRCARCELIVYKMSEHAALAKKYGVRVVPTVIIDDEVKIEGRPDIPFVCSEEPNGKAVVSLTVDGQAQANHSQDVVLKDGQKIVMVTT